MVRLAHYSDERRPCGSGAGAGGTSRMDDEQNRENEATWPESFMRCLIRHAALGEEEWEMVSVRNMGTPATQLSAMVARKMDFNLT